MLPALFVNIIQLERKSCSSSHRWNSRDMQEAVLTLFNRALQYNDPKQLYFALLGIYENPRQPQGPQHDMADQLLKTMTRKFNTSAKVDFLIPIFFCNNEYIQVVES